MDNKKFNKKLIDKIKKEDIKQVPKYIFVFKNLFVWFFLVLSVFLGAISLGISFDYLVSADWYLFNKIGFLKVLLIFLPLFWVVFLILSSFLSYYNYRHTNKGYKLSLLKVFTLNIVLSFLLAGLLYFSGSASYIESKMEKYIPKYRSILVDDKASRMIKVWQNENEGLLIGEILEVGENKLSFKDFNNKSWNLILHNDVITEIKGRVNLLVGEKVKIIGEKISENNFDVIEVRPFIGNKKQN